MVWMIGARSHARTRDRSGATYARAQMLSGRMIAKHQSTIIAPRVKRTFTPPPSNECVRFVNTHTYVCVYVCVCARRKCMCYEYIYLFVYGCVCDQVYIHIRKHKNDARTHTHEHVCVSCSHHTHTSTHSQPVCGGGTARRCALVCRGQQVREWLLLCGPFSRSVDFAYIASLRVSTARIRQQHSTPQQYNQKAQHHTQNQHQSIVSDISASIPHAYHNPSPSSVHTYTHTQAYKQTTHTLKQSSIYGEIVFRFELIKNRFVTHVLLTRAAPSF